MAHRFTLLDEPYYRAMLCVAEALEERGLDFCLVGGGATQAWVASLRTGRGLRRLSDEPVLRTALRKTRDLDFSTRTDAATMLSVLNRLTASFGSGAHVLGPRALRLGSVALSFTIEPADLSAMADLYDTFLASRRSLPLRQGAEIDSVPVIGVEELLATKLTRRGDKAKDMLDVTELMSSLVDAGKGLDLKKLRDLLHDRSQALALVDELAIGLEAATEHDRS